MYPVLVSKVAAALGGVRTLGIELATMDSLADAVAQGLPRGVVPQIAAAAAMPRSELGKRVAALVVSPATFKRSKRLSPAASERAERLARVTAPA